MLRKGEISVNSQTQKQAKYLVSENDQVHWGTRRICAQGPVYLMLNKPQGYVCDRDDPHHPCALELINELDTSQLHFAGRLDVDTTGLVLITSDGQWSHRITNPRKQKYKRYYVTLADPVSKEQLCQLEEGIMLRGEDKPTLPAKTIQHNEHEVELAIMEGRYHQVKRMFAAVGNKVEALHRLAIGPYELDGHLDSGSYRRLTKDEMALV